MNSLAEIKPNIVSLFTGAGGLDQGFRAAGFNVLCAVETEDWACRTLATNHPEMQVIGPPKNSGDVRTLDGKEICEIAKISPEDVDVIIGGPPCQPFSQAAAQRFWKKDERFKRKGFKDVTRGTLLLDLLRIIKEIGPRVFLFENVPGLLSIDGGKQLQLAISSLKESGYNVSKPKVLNASHYGAPQNRERLIIWGSRTVRNPSLPEPTHYQDSGLFFQPYKTVAHALAGMSQDLFNHDTRNHRTSSIERYRTLRFGQREKRGRVDRLDPFRPSKTVIAGGSNGGGRSHLHPFIARTLSPRECARLQTFNDDYIFEGSMARQFTQVGNAVPPLLAEHIARHIMSLEFGKKVTETLLHGPYLEHDEDLPDLVNILFQESKQIKPEWIYYNHSDAEKVFSDN
jgi:DNA (cytosine-5)-methyltransferase 1